MLFNARAEVHRLTEGRHCGEASHLGKLPQAFCQGVQEEVQQAALQGVWLDNRQAHMEVLLPLLRPGAMQRPGFVAASLHVHSLLRPLLESLVPGIN